MTNKKIIIISLSFTSLHFVLTSLSGHYIAFQIGTDTGKIVSAGLIEASTKNPDKAQEEATIINQNMETKSSDTYARWKVAEFLISLPARPLITPLMKEMRKQQMSKVIAKEISPEQFRTRGLMIGNTISLLNSLLLGFLIYVGLRFFYRKQTVR